MSEFFTLFSVLITLAALASYVNARTLKLPSGVVLMLMGTLLSITLIATAKTSPAFTEMVRRQLGQIDFSEFILGVLLSFLIFAGSLHVRLRDLRDAAFETRSGHSAQRHTQLTRKLADAG